MERKNKIERQRFFKILKGNYHQVLLVFAAFLTMVLVSTFYVSKIVGNQMLVICEETMNTTQTAVSSDLEAAGLLFSDIHRSVEKLIEEDSGNIEIEAYLTTMQKYYTGKDSPLPEYMKIYAYIRGEFLDGSDWVLPEGYEPTERPWYTGAVDNEGSLYFTEPYQDADTGKMCVSFSRTLTKIDGEYNILAIDLDLSQVTKYIREQEISNNGYGVFISNNFTFLTHESKPLVEKSMSDAGKGYAKLQDMLQKGATISAVTFTDYDGSKGVAFFRTLFNGWYIGIIIPQASYTQPVRELGLVISAIGIVSATILSFLLVRTRIQKMKSEEESMSKSNFLARMSHEIRTPMNVIIGMTEIARGTNDQDKMEKCLGKINDASKHLLGVINDVLDMAKIESGKLELSPIDFAVASMLTQIETIIKFKVEEKHQYLSINIDERIPEILFADRQRLAQVILNLLSNANKFTPENGEITLSALLLENTEHNCRLQFTVKDTGIGIPKENQAKLFIAYEQADNSITRKYGGTGLGLSISKKIVEMMGGRIWIDSEVDQGTAISFTIDVKTGTLSDSMQEAIFHTVHDETKDIFKGKHLLVAEDVKINQEIIITLLDDTGIIIDCASNGQEVYEVFMSNPRRYDMIFMDIHMPGVDGLEATRKIRAINDPWAKRIPIVAMTADVFREDIERCHAAGMDDHTGKPLDIKDVINKIKYYTTIKDDSSR